MADLSETTVLVLVGLLAGIFLLLAVILVMMIANGRRARAEPDRVEPGLHQTERPRSGVAGAYAPVRRGRSPGGYAERGGPYLRRPPAPEPSGRPLRPVWFVAGILTGALAAYPFADPASFDRIARQVAAPLEDFVAARTAETPEPVRADEPIAPKSADRIGSAGSAERLPAPRASSELSALAQGYVANILPELPIATAPGISLTTAIAHDDVVALGFQIAEILADEDAEKLRAELEPRFRSSVCASEPGLDNIHGLNDEGVSFEIAYVDSVGRIVAEMSVGPGFCASPG